MGRGDDERFENDWVASSFCESLTNYNVYPERLEEIPFEMGAPAMDGFSKQQKNVAVEIKEFAFF